MLRSIIRPLVRSLAVVLALLLGLILSAQPASAATGWTSPALIMSGHDLQQVAMGVDASGAIHVVGLDGRGIFYRTNRTGAWSTVRLADTPQHFAAAFDVPVITLFGPTHIAWSETHYARAIHLQHQVDCGPCQQRVCPLGHHRCLRDLGVDEVFRAVRNQLDDREAHAA